MSDDQITIRIGAVKDPSIDRVFRSIQSDAKKFGQAASKATSSAVGDAGAVVKENKKKARSYQETAREVTDAIRSIDKAEKSRIKDTQKAEKTRASAIARDLKSEQAGIAEKAKWEQDLQKQRMAAIEKRHRAETRVRNETQRAETRVRNERDRANTKSSKEEAKNALKARNIAAYEHKQKWQRRAGIASYTASRSFGNYLPRVPSITQMGYAAGELARGVGIDVSPAQWLTTARGRESSMTDLSNAAVIPNDKQNSTRVPTAQLLSESRAVADRYGLKSTDTDAGLSQYVKITGDLKSARDLLDPLSKLAVATGTDVGQLFGTAANISNQIGDDLGDDEKAAMMMRVMRNFAGQGKVGAVELPDLARYGARLASSARFYEGDRESTLTDLGIIAQKSREAGGSNTPAMAATSVDRLLTTFKTGARVAEFEDQGIRVHNKQTGQIRNPVEIIREALEKTRSDPVAWNKLFMNIMGERGAAGLAAPYRDARIAALNAGMSEKDANEAGLRAYDDDIANMRSQTLSEKQADENVSEKMKTIDASVNQLNNAFTDIAASALPELARSIRDATPTLIAFAQAGAGAATWMLENPKSTIAGGLGLTAMMSGLAIAFRVAIEAGVMKLGAMFAGKAAAAALPAVVGAGASTVLPTVAATAAATTGAGSAFATGFGALAPMAILAGIFSGIRADIANLGKEGNAGGETAQADSRFGFAPYMNTKSFKDAAKTPDSSANLTSAIDRLASAFSKGIPIRLSGIPGAMAPGQISTMTGDGS